MTSNSLFDANTRLADLVMARPELLSTLSRFGISLGFGDKTVATVCSECGVAPDFFLLMCNVYAFSDYAPSLVQLMRTHMQGLVPFLKQSHLYYRDKRLLHISNHIGRIAALLPGERLSQAFLAFFNAYCDEVTQHFEREEREVFPHIEALQRGERDDHYRLADFSKSHGDLREKLDDLTQIIFKYLPASASSDDSIDVITDLLQLSADLKKHYVVEEKIMVPYVKQLEKSVR